MRLCAEGRMLVAYGFGGQRVEIPAGSIRQVWIHPEFEVRSGGRVREALLVLGARQHILLKAPGVWGPGVREVCRHLGLIKQPVVLDPASASRKVPSLADAENCQRLRVRPAGGRTRRIAAVLGRALLGVGGGIGGASLGLLLPAPVGDARILVASGLGIVGALAGSWLYNFGIRLLAGVIRWAVASRRAGTLAPVRPFLQFSRASSWTG